MNHVGRILCDPNLGLPSDAGDPLSEICLSQERSDKNASRGACRGHATEDAVSFFVYWIGAMHRFNQKHPVAFRFIGHDVRQSVSALWHSYADSPQSLVIDHQVSVI